MDMQQIINWLGNGDQLPDDECLNFKSSSNIKVQLATNMDDGNADFYSYKIGTGGIWINAEIKAMNDANINDYYISVPANTPIFFRRTTSNKLSNVTKKYRFMVSGTTYNASGNIASLLNSVQYECAPYTFQQLFSTTPIASCYITLPFKKIGSYSYASMFQNCTNLTYVSQNLLSGIKDVPNYGYQSMFRGCTNLLYIPNLPASSLGVYAYDHMFANCERYNGIDPLLLYDVTKISNNSCQYMFQNCFALTEAVQIPLINGEARYTYSHMFQNCTSLKNFTTPFIKSGDTIGINMFEYMFYGCTALTAAPKLPVSKICFDGCFMMFSEAGVLSAASLSTVNTFDPGSCWSMYRDCSSLEYIPQNMFGTTRNVSLQISCFNSMFEGCSSLISIPSGLFKNISTTKQRSFQSMFSRCKSLTSVPSGLIENITEHGIQGCAYMFAYCTSLKSGLVLPEIPLNNYCYQGMFNGCTSMHSFGFTLPYENAADFSKGCFDVMFSQCSTLSSLSTQQLDWKDSTSSMFTTNWLSNVAKDGEFYCAPELEEKHGPSYIPCGWVKKSIPFVREKEGVDTRRGEKGGFVNSFISGDTNYIVYPLPLISGKSSQQQGVILVIEGVRRRLRIQKSGNVYNFYLHDTESYMSTEEYRGSTQNVQNFSLRFNKKLYKFLLLQQYQDPLCLYSLNSQDFEVKIQNKNPGNYWAVVTRDNLNANATMTVCDNASSLVVPILGTSKAYIYNLGDCTYGSATGASNCSNISTTDATNPICMSGQFDSISGYARQDHSAYLSCYYGMFRDFKGLKKITNTTILPWTYNTGTIPNYYCYNMFYGCINLTGDVTFNSNYSTLSCGKYAYKNMFQNCKSLTNVTPFSVQNTNEHSHDAMFKGCTSLTDITFNQLSSNQDSTYRKHSFQQMFQGCAKLTSPTISLYFHSDIGQYSYENMFKGCNSLIEQPNIQTDPTVFLSRGCCKGMFQNCISLTDFNLDLLSATEYNHNCCQDMFKGCDSLTFGVPTNMPSYSDTTYFNSRNIPYPNYNQLATATPISSNNGQLHLRNSSWVQVSVLSTQVITNGDIQFGVTSNMYYPEYPLYQFGQYNCMNTWFLPLRINYDDGTDYYFKWECANSGAVFRVSDFGNSTDFIRYPDYSKLIGPIGNWSWSGDSYASGYSAGNTENTGNVALNEWYEVGSEGGWLLISVITQTGTGDINLITRGGLNEYTTKLYSFTGSPAIKTTWLIPIHQDFKITSPVPLERIQFCEGIGPYIGYPDYNQLKPGSDVSRRIPHGQNFSAPCDGWISLTAGSGLCVRLSLNSLDWNYALPLYSASTPDGASNGRVNYLLPIQRGTSVKFVCNSAPGVESFDQESSPVIMMFAPNEGMNVNTGYKGYGNWGAIPKFQCLRGYNTESCYGMFDSCSSLQYAPVFPSTVHYRSDALIPGYWKEMFKNCTNLKAIKWECTSAAMVNINSSSGMLTNAGSGVLYTAYERDSFATSSQVVMPSTWIKIKI